MTPSRKIAMSVGTLELLTDEGMNSLRESGIQALEVSLKIELQELYDPYKTAENARKNGIELWSFHLPFSPFEKINISSLDPELRKNSVQIQSELIRRASQTGVKCVVIHPSGEPIKDCEREEMLKASQESLFKLAQVAGKEGVTLCVEELPRTCLGRNAEEIERLISADDRLRVCFDMNHLLYENEKPEDFVRALNEKIATVHISDYDFKNERHWLPGEGDIDWTALMNALDEGGYTGPLMYEVGFATPASIIRPREITAADIAANARVLAQGKTPPSFGTRVDGLKYWYE